MKKVYIYMAEGFEEIEALAPADLLRRAGAQVTLVSITDSLTVCGARGVSVVCDSTVSDSLSLPDMIVLPGGYPGYKNLAESKQVEDIIKLMLDQNRFVAAICASPAAVLGAKGLLKNSSAVCYPGMEDSLNCKKIVSDGVCSDGNIITAKSAAFAIDFSLTLIERLFDAQTRRKVADQIVYND